jgi:glycosyltransferase involved in cell wall biosynthesis
MMGNIKAFPFYTGTSGCDFHRVRLPFMYADEYLHADTYQDFEIERLLEFIDKSRVVVWNRVCPIDINHILKARERQGLRIVVDLDDWVELPFKHPNFKYFRDHQAKLILENVKIADAVTCTTERLRKKLLPFNKNVHVIPNALPYGYDQFSPGSKIDPDIYRVIYTGQTSHLEDVRLLQNPMNRIKNLKIGFALAGVQNNPIWKQMEKVFQIAPNYTRIPNKDLMHYMEAYNGFDCSIVPLLNNTFNAHKSNLKLLEAAAKMIPVVVSKVPPYSDDIDAPVFWVEKQSDWFDHLNRLVKNPSLGIDKAHELREWANEKYNLFAWNKYRFDLYARLSE